MKKFALLFLLGLSSCTYVGKATRHIFGQDPHCAYPGLDGTSKHCVAITSDHYDGSNGCGGCIEVTGPFGEKDWVRVVDHCPGCGTGKNSMDLSYDVFNKLSHTDKGGMIDITWDWISCPDITPETKFEYFINNGANDWYMCFQIRNAKTRIKNVYMYSDVTDTWLTTTRREDFFFFVSPGYVLKKPIHIKVESIDGEIVEDVLEKFEPGLTMQGNVNFKE